jgi:hypothetical protein
MTHSADLLQHELDQLISGIESMTTLTHSIRTYGLEPQLKAVVTGNEAFQNVDTTSPEQVCAAIESVVSNVWEKIKEWWERFVTWVRRKLTMRDTSWTEQEIKTFISDLKELKTTTGKIDPLVYAKVRQDQSASAMHMPRLDMEDSDIRFRAAKDLNVLFKTYFPISKYDETLRVIKAYIEHASSSQDTSSDITKLETLDKYFTEHIAQYHGYIKLRFSKDAKGSMRYPIIDVVPTHDKLMDYIDKLSRIASEALVLVRDVDSVEDSERLRVVDEIRTIIKAYTPSTSNSTDPLKNLQTLFHGIALLIGGTVRNQAAIEGFNSCKEGYLAIKRYVDKYFPEPVK